MEPPRAVARRLGMCWLYPAIMDLMRIDAETLHQPERHIRGTGDEAVESIAMGLAERLFDLRWRCLGMVRNDQSVVASGGGGADLVALQQHHIGPAVARAERGCKSGETAADHEHIGRDIA